MRLGDRYHKWIEWSDDDESYLGRCPDVITGIHGEDPVQLYADLCDIVDDVLTDLRESGRNLPRRVTRPMRDVA